MSFEPARKPDAPAASLAARPKALLHEHLDGGLRPATLFELATARGLALPATTPEALGRWMSASADSGSLEDYLRGFALTVAAMASLEACERVAFEAAEDARADGCVLAEFRIAPLLLEPFGLAAEAVVEALLAGLGRSALPCGLILCGMRTASPQDTLRTAQLVAAYRDRGVVGFDLAGAERGNPPGNHAAAFRVVREAGLGITCHAGEADSGDRVIDAAALGATRIGHGIHLVSGTPDEVARRIERARGLGLHFEVCPSSNLHTGACARLEDHPIATMLRAGLDVSCSTDNRLISGVTLTQELEAVRAHCGLADAELAAMMRNAARASFLPADAKAVAVAAIEAGWSLP